MAREIYVKDDKFRNGARNQMTRIKRTQNLFPRSGPHEDDVIQTYNGSCYMLGLLRSLAGKDPARIRNLFKDNQDSTVTVRFYETGDNGAKEALDVKIDKTLPATDMKSPPWVRLMEKAFVASGLMKKESFLAGRSLNTTPDSEHPYMESLGWYDTGTFYEAITGEPVEKRNEDQKLIALNDNDKAIEEYTKELKYIASRNAVMTISTENHQMQVTNVGEKNGESGIFYFDQLTNTRNWVSIHDLFSADSVFDGVHVFYKDAMNKQVYLNTEPRAITKSIIRNNSPLTRQEFLNRTYNFYASQLQQLVIENHLQTEFPEGQARLNALLSYPTNRLDEKLDKYFDGKRTLNEYNALLEGTDEIADVVRDELMGELRVFIEENKTNENQVFKDVYRVLHAGAAAEEAHEAVNPPQGQAGQVAAEADDRPQEQVGQVATEANDRPQEQAEQVAAEADNPPQGQVQQTVTEENDAPRENAEQNTVEPVAPNPDRYANAAEMQLILGKICAKEILETGRKEGFTEAELKEASEYASQYVPAFANANEEYQLRVNEQERIINGTGDDEKKYRLKVMQVLKKTAEDKHQRKIGEPGQSLVIHLSKKYLENYAAEEEKNRPISQESFEKMMYDYYKRKIREAAEGTGLSEEQIEQLSEYPKGKMHESLVLPNGENVFTNGDVHEYLFGTGVTNEATRAGFLDILKNFLTQELQKENVPPIVREFGKLRFSTDEQYRNRQQEEADERTKRHAERTRRELGERFYDLPFPAPDQADMGKGTPSELPSAQIYKEYREAFSNVRKNGGKTAKPEYCEETAPFETYQAALKNAMQKDGISVAFSNDNIGQLIRLAQLSESNFRRKQRTDVPGNMSPSDVFYEKMAAVLAQDVLLLKGIRSSLLSLSNTLHPAETAGQQILEAKRAVLAKYKDENTPDGKRYTRVNDFYKTYAKDTLPALRADRFEQLSLKLDKQDANAWRRLNLITAQLDKMKITKDESYEYQKMRSMAENLSANRPLSHEDMIKQMQELAKQAEKALKLQKKENLTPDEEMKNRVLQALIRNSARYEKNMKTILKDMNYSSDQKAQEFVSRKRFAETQGHYDVKKATEERNRLAKQLTDEGYNAETFAKYYVLNQLVSSKATAEIKRLTVKELSIRTKECMQSSAMVIMNSAMTGLKMKPEQMSKCYLASLKNDADVKELHDIVPEVIEERLNALKEYEKREMHRSGNKDFDHAAAEVKKNLFRNRVARLRTERADRLKRVMAYTASSEMNSTGLLAQNHGAYVKDLKMDGVHSDFSIERNAVDVLGACILLAKGHTLKEIMMPSSLTEEKAAAGKEALDLMTLKSSAGREPAANEGKIAEVLYKGMKTLKKGLTDLQRTHDFGATGFTETAAGMEARYTVNLLSEISREWTKGRDPVSVQNRILSLAASELGSEGAAKEFTDYVFEQLNVSEKILGCPDEAMNKLQNGARFPLREVDLISAITEGIIVNACILGNADGSDKNMKEAERMQKYNLQEVREQWQENRSMRILAKKILKYESDLTRLTPYIMDGSFSSLFKVHADDQNGKLTITSVPTFKQCRKWAKERKVEEFKQTEKGLLETRDLADEVASTYAAKYMKESVAAMKQLVKAYGVPDLPLARLNTPEVSKLMTATVKGSFMAQCAKNGVSEKQAASSFERMMERQISENELKCAGVEDLRRFMMKDGVKATLDRMLKSAGMRMPQQKTAQRNNVQQVRA